MRKKLHCLPYCKFQPPVFVFGVPNPLFFGGFSPCVRLFRGGWDTYPTPEEKAAHRGDSGFYCFSQWWVVCAASVFSATQVNSVGTATVFQICNQMRSRYTSETEKCISDVGCACATPLPRKKKYQFCRRRNNFSTFTTLTTHNFLQGFLCDKFRLVLVQTHQPLGFSVDPNGHSVLPGRGFDEIFLC